MSFDRELDVFDDPSSYLFGFHSFPEEPMRLFHHHNHDYHFNACSHSPSSEVFDDCFDLTLLERAPCSSCYRRTRLRHRPDRCVQSLHEEVSTLESEFHRILGATKVEGAERKYTWKAKIKSPDNEGQDRKYEWRAKIKPGNDRKYKWKALIKGGKEEAACTHWNIDRRRTSMVDVENGVNRKYGWKAKIKPGDAPKYKWTTEFDNGLDKKCKWTGQMKGGKHSHAGVCIPGACNVEMKKGSSSVRVVEIDDPVDRRTAFRRQALHKRATAVAKAKGKKKELSAQDAAMTIQHNFREYVTRRSQSVRSLRELAVAKSKLREIKALFCNYSYRHRIARDAEERQRFSERIVVLLLTVDAIEGGDLWYGLRKG